jgi:hypothetical protein
VDRRRLDHTWVCFVAFGLFFSFVKFLVIKEPFFFFFFLFEIIKVKENYNLTP